MYFRQHEKCLTLECLDFCWINNAVFATLSCLDGVNSVTFWQWDGQDIMQEATISIKAQCLKISLKSHILKHLRHLRFLSNNFEKM